jgi:hypothetical protein
MAASGAIKQALPQDPLSSSLLAIEIGTRQTKYQRIPQIINGIATRNSNMLYQPSYTAYLELGRRTIYVFDLRDPFDERRNGNYGPTVRRAFIFFSKANFSNLEAYKSRLARLKQSISLTAALSMSHKSANADAILRNWGPA